MSIIVQKEKNYFLIKTKFPVLGIEEVEALSRELEALVKKKTAIILDLSELKQIKKITLPKLKELAIYCVEMEISIVLLADKDIHQFLFDHGLGYLIPSYIELDDALASLPNKTDIENIGRNFLASTIKSTQFTIKTMCGIDIQAEKEFTRGERPCPTADLASVISFNTDQFNVVFLLVFTKETLTKFMRLMLEDEQLQFGYEVQSGLAEFLNCLTGKLRSEIKELKVNTGIPSILINGSWNTPPMNQLMEQNSTIIPFTSKIGEFYIEYLAYVVKGSPKIT